MRFKPCAHLVNGIDRSLPRYSEGFAVSLLSFTRIMKEKNRHAPALPLLLDVREDRPRNLRCRSFWSPVLKLTSPMAMRPTQALQGVHAPSSVTPIVAKRESNGNWSRCNAACCCV